MAKSLCLCLCAPTIHAANHQAAKLSACVCVCEVSCLHVKRLNGKMLPKSRTLLIFKRNQCCKDSTKCAVVVVVACFFLLPFFSACCFICLNDNKEKVSENVIKAAVAPPPARGRVVTTVTLSRCLIPRKLSPHTHCHQQNFLF